MILLLSCCYLTDIWPYIHGFSITAVFFFSFGAYFSIHGKNMVDELYKYKTTAYLLYIPLLLLTWYFDARNTDTGQYIYSSYIIVSVIAVVNFAKTLTKQEKMNFSKHISDMTFFIYVFHGFLGLMLADKILNIVPIWNLNTMTMIICYFLKPILAIAICSIIYTMMKRICPRTLGFLTGNRKI